MFSRPAHQVPDDEEVGDKAQITNDLLLMLQALASRLMGVAVDRFQTFLKQAIKERLGGLVRPRLELGYVVLAQFQFDVHLIGYIHCGRHGFW